MYNWYLIQFKPNAHRVAERNLDRQGFKTFLPMIEITNRNRSKFRNSIKPLFPGYMFVAADNEKDPWYKIKSTIGVSRVVYDQGKPKVLKEELILSLMQRCNQFGILIAPKQPVIGDTVKLLSGVFADFVATVEKIDSYRRVWVMMELMGRPTRIQVANEQLSIGR